MKGTVQVTQDWSNDGFLRISGDQTLQRYQQLNDQLYRLDLPALGIFCAFSTEQFKAGLADIKARGLFKEGDKLQQAAGCFGTAESWQRYDTAVQGIKAQIKAECDPYEVYLYEYNNYECCIDWDGDDRAVEAVLKIWGLEETAAALYGRRIRSNSTIGEIYENLKN